MSHDDMKLRRAARRAQALRDGGPAAWAMPSRKIPSAKVYRRPQKSTARYLDA